MTVNNREAQLRLQSQVLAQLSDAVVVVDPDQRIICWNAGAAAIFGISAEQALGRPPAEIYDCSWLHSEDEQAARAALQAAGYWRGRLLYRAGPGNDHVLDVSLNTVRDEQGGTIGTAAVYRDITDLHTLETEQARLAQELQRQTDELRIFETLVDNAPDGIAIAELNGTIRYANASFQEMHGYGIDTVGMILDNMLSDQSQLQPMQEHITGHGYWRGVVTLWRADRTTFPCQTSAFVIYGVEGAPQALVVIGRDMSEQVRREEELRIFKTLVDNAPEGIAVTDLAGIFQYTNTAHCLMHGYRKADALLGLPISTILIEEQELSVSEQLYQHGHWQGMRLHRRADGSTFPSHASIFMVYDAAGQPFAIAAIDRDMSEQVQRESELRTFKTLVDNAPDGIGISRLDDSTIMYANTSYQAMHGYGQNIIGVSSSMLLPDEKQLEPALRVLREQNYWRGVITHRRADGSTFPVHASVFMVYDAAGQPQALAAIDRDISQQMKQAAELRSLQAMVEHTPDGAVLLDFNGTIVYANPAMGLMTGYGDALVGMHAQDYHVEEDLSKLPLILQSVREHGIWQGRLIYRRKDGSTFPVSAAVFMIADNQGQPFGLAGFIRDMTEQERQSQERAALQQQIIEAQRAALRELLTPLIPLTDSTLVMPLIGAIDSARAIQIMETLLEGIAQHRAAIAILDITGVQVIDTQVAGALIQAAQAARLLGAQVVLTGIQPRIAQTLVELGIDLGDLVTYSSLQAGVAYAMREETANR